MSDKLIDIAKECGAVRINGTGPLAISDDQLRATIEQVCAPLVAALEYAEHVGDLLDASGDVESAINGYHAIMGDKK